MRASRASFVFSRILFAPNKKFPIFFIFELRICGVCHQHQAPSLRGPCWGGYVRENNSFCAWRSAIHPSPSATSAPLPQLAVKQECPGSPTGGDARTAFARCTRYAFRLCALCAVSCAAACCDGLVVGVRSEIVARVPRKDRNRRVRSCV